MSRDGEPGEAGIWVFILGDLVIFTLFFATFTFYRGQSLALYTESQQTLHQSFGALNTVFLLTSSLFVALAMNALRREADRVATGLLALAFCCGAGFLTVKWFEYGEKLRAGITLTTNEFYSFYYVLTGLHMIHVILGMGVLTFMCWGAWRGGGGPRRIVLMESGASFWHMVDILWVLIFPLLYLMK
jgi:nitric oxide reductase NorE protein